MGEPVSLDSIYTTVQLLEARNILKFASQDEMEKAFKSTKERHFAAQDNQSRPGQDLISQIKDFLATNLNAPKHLDGKKVLREIEVQQGILVQRAENIYSFSHLT